MNIRVVLHKHSPIDGELWALLAAFRYDGRYFVTSWDPRNASPVAEELSDEASARSILDDTIRSCCDRGWTVSYYGRLNAT